MAAEQQSAQCACAMPLSHENGGIISDRFDDLGRDGAPRRLGIMGGTFDPIHIGHLAGAEQAREAFGLDAVIFVPTGSPAFKQHQKVTPACQRLAMCRLAVLPNPHFDVSAIEIEREGVTYTVDTVRAFRAHYPDNVELFFITGADSILSIARWKKSAEIASMIRFIAMTRPGYAVTDAFKEELASLGEYRVEYLETTALAISSSELRRRVASGKSLRYLTMLSVCDYIHRNGLYRGSRAPSDELVCPESSGEDHLRARLAALGARVEDVHAEACADACDCDVLGREFFSARKAELANRVGRKRFAHCEGVAHTSEVLAKTYGVDPRRARLAGILHDWDKGYDDPGIRRRACEVDLDVDPIVIEQMPRVLHGMTAARALARAFPEIPADVLQAVDRHTVAAIGMEPLDMVLYVADAIEPNRKGERVEELREMVGTATLEELYEETYRYWVELMLVRHCTLHPDTIAIWNDIVARRARRKGKKAYERNA